MSETGPVRLLVKSRRVAVGTTLIEDPVYTLFGTRVSLTQRRGIVFEQVYDEAQRKAIAEAKRLSCSLGLPLDVIDISSSGFFRRAISRILGWNGSLLILPERLPSIETPIEPEKGSMQEETAPTLRTY